MVRRRQAVSGGRRDPDLLVLPPALRFGFRLANLWQPAWKLGQSRRNRAKSAGMKKTHQPGGFTDGTAAPLVGIGTAPGPGGPTGRRAL